MKRSATELAIILLFGAAAGLSFQRSTATDQLHKLQEGLRKAHIAKDAPEYLRNAYAMRDFLNGAPNSILQLTSAQAFAGKTDDALASLAQFAQMGQSNEPALQLAGFDSIRKLPRFAELQAQMAANNAHALSASKVFALDDPALIPEDIDFDPAQQMFYITSVGEAKIIAVTKRGESHLFAKAPDGWPMLALKIDTRRGLLWATEVAMNGFTSVPRADWSRSAILLYNLTTGALTRRLEAPAHTALGDMALTNDGNLILSDGENGGVYRLDRETFRIERIDSGDFISPQTPALVPGGQRIFIPDYVRGIGILDLTLKRVSWISMVAAYALNGIDGLYLSGRTLIATQNGTSPERVVRFHLDPALSRIESQSIIERATPTLGDPTHGVIVDDQFFYIANSGWNTLDEHGQHKPGTIPSAALVMRAAPQSS